MSLLASRCLLRRVSIRIYTTVWLQIKRGKSMFQGARALLGVVSAVVCLGLSAAAWAGSVLIVNGASATSEPSTTADITAHLQALEAAAGNSTTVVDIPPASLAAFDEVWDMRFSNSWPLTAGDQAEYLA